MYVLGVHVPLSFLQEEEVYEPVNDDAEAESLLTDFGPGDDASDEHEQAGMGAVEKELEEYKAVAPADSGPANAKPNMARNPLQFWRENEKHYPILARVAL